MKGESLIELLLFDDLFQPFLIVIYFKMITSHLHYRLVLLSFNKRDWSVRGTMCPSYRLALDDERSYILHQ
jgi:hypothetical protein